MRHSDIRTTQKYYHEDIENLRDIVNARGNGSAVKFGAPQSLV